MTAQGVFLLRETGIQLPSTVVTDVTTTAGEAGAQAGAPIFRAIGFYMDNIDTVTQNIETFVAQLNDYRSWSTPDLSC
jgi:hypothetical protein